MNRARQGPVLLITHHETTVAQRPAFFDATGNCISHLTRLSVAAYLGMSIIIAV